MPPTMGMLGRHVLEHGGTCGLGKRAQQTLTHRRVGADDGARRSNCSGGGQDLGSRVEVEAGDERGEIAIGEPMDGAGR